MPGDLEDAGLQAAEDFIAARGPVATTHGEWSREFLTAFGDRILADKGSFWVYTQDDMLWKELSIDHAAVWVSERWNGPKCRSAGDYRAIVQLGYDKLTRDRPRPFATAPLGVAAGMSFYRVERSEIVREPLAPEHLARFKLPCGPDWDHPAPRLQSLEDGSFPLSDPDSKDQRTLMWQQIAAAIFGLAWRAQKAILWYGPGAAGKSTFQKILRATLPPNMVSAVPPHLWDAEYHAAALAGKRLNLVGEIDEKRPLGAAFKTATGNDLLQGRHPTHRPFSFVCEAAQVFNCNGLPATMDRSEAFWRRWSVVHFRYVTPEAERDDLLAERIVEDEMPALLARAFDGARSLMASGKARYLATKSQDGVLGRWRRQTNSVEEFLHDDETCVLEPGAVTGRVDLFRAYKEWCAENKRHAFGRNQFRDQMLAVGPRAGVEEGRAGAGSRAWSGVRIMF